MAGHEDSYIAWDGRRYDGPPPAGWYLAADNRWWPSQDLINAGPMGEADGPAGAGTTNAAGGSVAEGPTARTSTTGTPPPTPPPVAGPRFPPQPPAPDWAPRRALDRTSGQPQQQPAPIGHSAPSPPGGTSVTGVPVSGRSSATGAAPPLHRRRRRNKAGRGFLIPVLAFLLFRCVAAADSGAELATPAPVPTPVPTTALVVADSPAITGLPPVIAVTDLQVTPTGCGPGTFTAGVTNVGLIATSFDVTIEIAELSELGPQSSMTVERTIGPLEPGQSEPLIVPLEGPLVDAQRCALLRVSPAGE